MDKFLKDMVDGNIKSAVAYANSKDIYLKHHENHEFYHQHDFNYSSAFIVITLKNDQEYFVVPSSCCCPYLTFEVKEIDPISKCDCK